MSRITSITIVHDDGTIETATPQPRSTLLACELATQDGRTLAAGESQAAEWLEILESRLPVSAANIAPSVLRMATALGLTWSATGGGCDFVTTSTINATLVLSDSEDLSFSPVTLTDPASVTLYQFSDEEWLHGITFPFPSALDAMIWMRETVAKTQPAV